MRSARRRAPHESDTAMRDALRIPNRNMDTNVRDERERETERERERDRERENREREIEREIEIIKNEMRDGMN